MMKMEFHFFCLFLKWITVKIIAYTRIFFQDFFNGALFLLVQGSSNLRRLSLYYEELRSVEIYLFWLWRSNPLNYVNYYSLWQRCNDLYWKFKFLHLKINKIRSVNDKDILFFVNDSRDTGQSLYFFYIQNLIPVIWTWKRLSLQWRTVLWDLG